MNLGDSFLGLFIYVWEFMEKNSGAITVLISIITAVWAVYSLSLTLRREKDQIRNSKLEEIYELITLLFTDYSPFFDLYIVLKDYYDDRFDKDEKQTVLEKYRNELKKVKANIDTDQLINKMLRLNALTNIYLDKRLKKKVLSFTKLYEHLLLVTTQQNWMYKEIFFKEGFPNDQQLYLYLTELGKELIKDIDFSKEQITTEEFKDYRENEFKKVLGLKEN